MHSRQIRPPIYSLKQSKLRKRRVVRYAILYFSMFFLFIILIIGPGVAGKYGGDLSGTIWGILGGDGAFDLLQPAGLNHNDTSGKLTGTAIGKGAANTGGGSPSASASSIPGAPNLRRAMFAYDAFH